MTIIKKILEVWLYLFKVDFMLRGRGTFFNFKKVDNLFIDYYTKWYFYLFTNWFLKNIQNKLGFYLFSYWKIEAYCTLKKIVNYYHKKIFHMDFLKVVWDICWY